MGVRRVEADPVVAYAECLSFCFPGIRRPLRLNARFPEFDTSQGSGTGELYRIAHQVSQRDLQKSGVARRRQAGFDYEVDPAFGVRRVQAIRNAPRYR